MRREEIENLMEQIRDMKNQVHNLYMDALNLRAEFDVDFEEYAMIDAAMDHIDDAENDLDYGIDELS